MAGHETRCADGLTLLARDGPLWSILVAAFRHNSGRAHEQEDPEHKPDRKEPVDEVGVRAAHQFAATFRPVLYSHDSGTMLTSSPVVAQT